MRLRFQESRYCYIAIEFIVYTILNSLPLNEKKINSSPGVAGQNISNGLHTMFTTDRDLLTSDIKGKAAGIELVRRLPLHTYAYFFF